VQQTCGQTDVPPVRSRLWPVIDSVVSGASVAERQVLNQTSSQQRALQRVYVLLVPFVLNEDGSYGGKDARGTGQDGRFDSVNIEFQMLRLRQAEKSDQMIRPASDDGVARRFTTAKHRRRSVDVELISGRTRNHRAQPEGEYFRSVSGERDRQRDNPFRQAIGDDMPHELWAGERNRLERNNPCVREALGAPECV